MATDTTAQATPAVDELLPPARLFTLGLQHVLVMYAGAIAVPLIVGRALALEPEQVAFLISADLFVCGLVTIIQSYGLTPWFGVKLPVMMGVTFASVGPMEIDTLQLAPRFRLTSVRQVGPDVRSDWRRR